MLGALDENKDNIDRGKAARMAVGVLDDFKAESRLNSDHLKDLKKLLPILSVRLAQAGALLTPEISQNRVSGRQTAVPVDYDDYRDSGGAQYLIADFTTRRPSANPDPGTPGFGMG